MRDRIERLRIKGKRWWATPLLVLLGALIGKVAPHELFAQEIFPVRLGTNANSARNLAQIPYVAVQRLGFLTREHIALTLVPLMGTTYMISALDKGEVDATDTATPYMIEAVQKGSDAAAIIGGVANPVYSLIARPDIKTIGDLRGKLIAVSASPDTITLSTRLLLARSGLRDGDYRTKEIIGSTQRADCLTHGDCDAVPLGQPDDISLAEQGFTKLGDSLAVIPKLQFNVIAARRSWSAAHKGAIMALVRAFADTFRYLRDPANRDDVAKMIVETTGVTDHVAQAVLTLYYHPDRGIMPKQGEIDMAGMQEVIALLGSAGVLTAPLPPPERFVDLQFLHAAGLQ